MKIQTCELPNTGLLKTNSSTKNMQRPRTSYSTNDLLFAQAMKNKEDENRVMTLFHFRCLEYYYNSVFRYDKKELKAWNQLC